LCGSPKLKSLKSLSDEQIRDLWRMGGINFQSPLFNQIEPGSAITLMGCVPCGFRFFDPDLAGSACFYERLAASSNFYYSNQRSEFFRTIKFADQHQLTRVLDVGCGTGLFLDLAKQHGLITAGAEMNLSAAEVSRSKGHLMFDGPIQAWDRKYHAFFDLICLFQVLEHLPDPVSFLLELKPFLSAQGIFSVAVPNRLGGLRLTPFEPSNWPPHHVSHWSLPDLEQLADRAGLLCLKRGADNMPSSHLYLFLSNRILQKKALGQKCSLNLLFVRIICFFYRILQAKILFPVRGHSIFAFFKKVA